MIYIFVGFVAFLLFFIYDLNSVIFKFKLLYGCFFAGFFLLASSTVGIIISWRSLIKIDVLRMVTFGILTLLFFLLLIYTLFFALPFKSTYIETETLNKVCRSGVYALCRHPGVLWFFGFYIFWDWHLIFRCF